MVLEPTKIMEIGLEKQPVTNHQRFFNWLFLFSFILGNQLLQSSII